MTSATSTASRVNGPTSQSRRADGAKPPDVARIVGSRVATAAPYRRFPQTLPQLRIRLRRRQRCLGFEAGRADEFLKRSFEPRCLPSIKVAHLDEQGTADPGERSVQFNSTGSSPQGTVSMSSCLMFFGRSSTPRP